MWWEIAEEWWCFTQWYDGLFFMRGGAMEKGKKNMDQYLNHDGLDFDVRRIYIRVMTCLNWVLWYSLQVVFSGAGPHEKTPSMRIGLMPIQRSRQGDVNHISTTWGMWLSDWLLSTTNRSCLSFLCPQKASVSRQTYHPISQENIYMSISEPVDSSVHENSTETLNVEWGVSQTSN